MAISQQGEYTFRKEDIGMILRLYPESYRLEHHEAVSCGQLQSHHLLIEFGADYSKPTRAMNEVGWAAAMSVETARRLSEFKTRLIDHVRQHHHIWSHKQQAHDPPDQSEIKASNNLANNSCYFCSNMHCTFNLAAVPAPDPVPMPQPPPQPRATLGLHAEPDCDAMPPCSPPRLDHNGQTTAQDTQMADAIPMTDVMPSKSSVTASTELRSSNPAIPANVLRNVRAREAAAKRQIELYEGSSRLSQASLVADAEWRKRRHQASFGSKNKKRIADLWSKNPHQSQG